MSTVKLNWAHEDIHHHKTYGVSLNPFSTEGARKSWQNGFDSVTEKYSDYSFAYARGQLAAKIIKESKQQGI